MAGIKQGEREREWTGGEIGDEKQGGNLDFKVATGEGTLDIGARCTRKSQVIIAGGQVNGSTCENDTKPHRDMTA